MYTLLEVPSEFAKQAGRFRELVAELLQGLGGVHRTEETFPTESVALADGVNQGDLFLIKEGKLICERDGRQFFFYEEGDLLGIQSLFSSPNIIVRTDFAVVVERMPGTDFLEAIRASSDLLQRWQKTIECYLGLQFILMRAVMKETMQFSPTVLSYSKGDVIIEQGASGTEVLTMAEGHAEVLVDDVIVGEVLADEIFGAIAGMTGTSRTATVRATKDSVVLSLSPDKFVELVQSRPHTVHKLVEGMARKIVDLNEKVVEQGKNNS